MPTLDTTLTTTTATLPPLSRSDEIWIIVAGIIAIIGAVLLHFLFVKKKADPKGKFAKWLKDFLSFKSFWIETLLKVCYYASTIFVIVFSFNALTDGAAGIPLFLVTLIGGPIAVRLAYEATMMFVMIWHNTRDIAENTKKK